MIETIKLATNEKSSQTSGSSDDVAQAVRELQQFDLIEDQPAAQYPPSCLSCS